MTGKGLLQRDESARAHVRRRDFLVNPLTSVVTVLLLCRPVASPLGKRVPLTREICCDPSKVDEVSFTNVE